MTDKTLYKLGLGLMDAAMATAIPMILLENKWLAFAFVLAGAAGRILAKMFEPDKTNINFIENNTEINGQNNAGTNTTTPS